MSCSNQPNQTVPDLVHNSKLIIHSRADDVTKHIYVDCFVEFYGWYEDENMVFIAMEYIEHGDLQSYMNQPFSEAHAKVICSQLVEGLGYMHENGFAHRDLKPKNILVYRPGPDWWVKIGDFGITKRIEQDTALRTVIGTRHYVAPEVIGFVSDQGSASSSDALSYTVVVDMWALGELLFRMIAQRHVFLSQFDLFNYVFNKHPFPLATLKDTGVSQDCCSFVTKCLAANPKNRLTVSDAAVHPWVQISRPSSRSSSHNSPMRSVQYGNRTITTTNLGHKDGKLMARLCPKNHRPLPTGTRGGPRYQIRRWLVISRQQPSGQPSLRNFDRSKVSRLDDRFQAPSTPTIIPMYLKIAQ
ncbi:GTPase grn1 [Verticillium dahliae VDG1]|nr:GTPase grn1 [Verticillium dahliae VDG1]